MWVIFSGLAAASSSGSAFIECFQLFHLPIIEAKIKDIKIVANSTRRHAFGYDNQAQLHPKSDQNLSRRPFYLLCDF